jgi:hypothetical protein
MRPSGPAALPALASTALLSIIAPLPSLASLAAVTRLPPPLTRSPPAADQAPAAKRPRTAPVPPAPLKNATAHSSAIPRDIAAAVDAIRRAGAPADTLFFAGLAPGLDDDAALRAAIRLPLRELKLLPPRGKSGKKALAWASFFNEADCVAALVALRRDAPELRPRLHTPRAGGGAAGPGVAAAEKEGAAVAVAAAKDAFLARAEKIVLDGGLANTVMLRGLPLEVSVDEAAAVVVEFDTCCRPLRVRTGEGKSGKVRNFWMTYASRDAACSAFVAMSGRSASFRCGKTQRIVPVVHNDATDAESKVRRDREAVIGAHPSAGELELCQRGARGVGGGAPAGTAAVGSSVERLEELLRRQSGRLFFIGKEQDPL